MAGRLNLSLKQPATKTLGCDLGGKSKHSVAGWIANRSEWFQASADPTRDGVVRPSGKTACT
jgi:hypothetical protein